MSIVAPPRADSQAENDTSKDHPHQGNDGDRFREATQEPRTGNKKLVAAKHSARDGDTISDILASDGQADNRNEHEQDVEDDIGRLKAAQGCGTKSAQGADKQKYPDIKSERLSGGGREARIGDRACCKDDTGGTPCERRCCGDVTQQ